MVTGPLKSQVDKVWNAFWSGGIANPLEVIEQITYLLFIKRLDELHTLAENKANTLGAPIENPVFPEGTDDSARRPRPYSDLRWSKFHNFSAQEMYEVIDVTDFVARLGYGEEYNVTSRSGVLGIDGIVHRDRLGLDRVYVQAKRYKADHPVSAEAVRAFIGSLGLHRASAGVMISTSTFAKTSREEVERTHSTNIRLIDGRELAHLMVKYDIGVTVERTISIKRLDPSQLFASSESA